MKVLFCGLPGSGKSTIAQMFAKEIDAVWINADAVREKYNDWDFSSEGRIRQAQRMRHLADGVVLAGKIAVADFVAPTKRARQEFDAEYVIWMNTIKSSRFEDTNKVFEPLDEKEYNYCVCEWFKDQYLVLADLYRWYQGCRQ